MAQRSLTVVCSQSGDRCSAENPCTHKNLQKVNLHYNEESLFSSRSILAALTVGDKQNQGSPANTVRTNRMRASLFGLHPSLVEISLLPRRGQSSETKCKVRQTALLLLLELLERLLVKIVNWLILCLNWLVFNQINAPLRSLLHRQPVQGRSWSFKIYNSLTSRYNKSQ